MTVHAAISQSSSGLALVVKKDSARILLAMNTSAGVRIVRSYTDPTVVRKLTDKEELLPNWEPVDLELRR